MYSICGHACVEPAGILHGSLIKGLHTVLPPSKTFEDNDNLRNILHLSSCSFYDVHDYSVNSFYMISVSYILPFVLKCYLFFTCVMVFHTLEQRKFSSHHSQNSYKKQCVQLAGIHSNMPLTLTIYSYLQLQLKLTRLCVTIT